jgi:hypothetical protein
MNFLLASCSCCGSRARSISFRRRRRAVASWLAVMALLPADLTRNRPAGPGHRLYREGVTDTVP